MKKILNAVLIGLGIVWIMLGTAIFFRYSVNVLALPKFTVPVVVVLWLLLEVNTRMETV